MYMKWQNYSHTNSQILLQNKPFIIENNTKEKICDTSYCYDVQGFCWMLMDNEIKLDSYTILVSV